MDRMLQFIQEPLLLVTAVGAIEDANPSARRLLGGDAVGRAFTELIVSPAREFQDYLTRCTGSTSPLPGVVTLRDIDGNARRFRTHAALLPRDPRDGRPTRLALRLFGPEASEFSVLARTVRELTDEIRHRRNVQSILERTLRERTVLLQELHHRVKNNIQVLIGLFSMTEREARDPALLAFLATAKQRLIAMGLVHRLMHGSQALESIPARAFLDSLGQSIAPTLRPDVRLELEVDESELPNAVALPLGLIVNELLSNAVRHGLKDGPGHVAVRLRRDGDDHVLTVHDSGPGLTVGESRGRASGLGMVRGLCRQIGGSFEVDNLNGARCTIKFPGGDARTIH